MTTMSPTQASWPSRPKDEQSAEVSDLGGLRALDESEISALQVLCRSLHAVDADLEGTLYAILTAAISAYVPPASSFRST